MHACVMCLYNFESQSFVCDCVRAKETGRWWVVEVCVCVCVCVWVCLSWYATEIMNVVTQTSQQGIAEGSGSSQGYPTVMNHSLKWEREKEEETEVWRKQQLQYFLYPNPLRNTQKTLWTYGCVCTNASLSSPSQFQLIYQSNFWPITYDRLIEAVWMLLHLSSSDSWASANEMILILCAEHVLCAVVNCVIICTVHTSLHAYSRWCVEGVVEGERDVRMLQFTLAV